MNHPFETDARRLTSQIFHGDGELPRLCREKDWSETPLGPLEAWPASLRTLVSMILAAPVPLIVLWGPELAQIYNDGYRELMGKKHPGGLGQPTRDCWPEVWEFNAPLYEGVINRRESFRFEDQPLAIERHGHPEEALFTLTYSPVTNDEGAVNGVLVTVFETTATAERARAEEASRDSEERLNAALEAADLGTWTLDLTSDDAAVRSLRHDQIFGYLDAQPKWGQEIALRHVLEEDRPIFRDAFARAAETGRLSFEVRVRWPDGSIHWIEAVGRTHYDRDKRPVRMAGVVAEVTERNQAEAMRQAAELGAFRVTLENALRSLGDPVEIQAAAARVLGDHLKASRVSYARVSEDEESVIIDADYCRGVASTVGRHRLDDFGSTVLAAVRAGRTLVVHDVARDPRSTAAERETSAALALGAHAAVPLTKNHRLVALLAVHQSEPRTWTDTEVALMQETAERTWAGVERAEAEAALRRSEAKYRTLFESIDEGFTIIEMLFDEEGTPDDYRFLEINPAFERHTGLVDAERKRIRELAPGHEQHWFDFNGRVALTGEPARIESPAQALDGRWLDVYAFRIGDPASRRVAVLFTDTTARRRADEALRDNDRRKDEFLAMLAHELRNPLAAIVNTVKLLERRSPEPGARRYLDILERQTDMLRGLVADLLDVSRITRGLVEIDRARVDLAHIAERALESTQAAMDEKRHEVSLVLPPEAVHVLGDPVRLEQVLVNLLGNAAKHTDPGGRVELRLERRGRSAELRVSDSGIGMTPEVLGRIFELFGQAERGLARSEGGLGIGLTIAKNLVELHGGRIEAHSAGPGKGSQFVVTLPLAPANEAVEAEASSAHGAPVLAKRILVVEDSPDVAETLALLLECAGHEVAVAHDGPAALEKAHELAPDIVLLDIGLPGMDGYELARKLRQDPGAGDPVLAAITGYGQPDDIARALAAGIARHFTKPVEIDALEAFVSEVEPRPRP